MRPVAIATIVADAKTPFFVPECVLAELGAASCAIWCGDLNLLRGQSFV